MSFDPSRFPVPVRDDLLAALQKSWDDIGNPGTWWTGQERVAIATLARSERTQRNSAPWERKLPVLAVELPEAAVKAVRRIAADPHSLDRDWVESIFAELDQTRYVEAASVVATVSATDAFCEALGIAHEALPTSQPGEPSHVLPEGLGDIGAWVPAVVEQAGANVGRAMSMVPAGVRTFFRLVRKMYAGKDFEEMVWEHRPLPRPQVELLAARVSAANQCFY